MYVQPTMCYQSCAPNFVLPTTNHVLPVANHTLPTWVQSHATLCFQHAPVPFVWAGSRNSQRRDFVYFLHLQPVSRIKSLYSCIKQCRASSVSTEYALLSLMRASQTLVHTLTPSPSPSTPKFSFLSQIYHDFAIFFCTWYVLHNRHYIDRQRYVFVPLLCQLLWKLY